MQYGFTCSSTLKNSAIIHMELALIHKVMATLWVSSAMICLVRQAIKIAMERVGTIMAIPSVLNTRHQQISFASQNRICKFSILRNLAGITYKSLDSCSTFNDLKFNNMIPGACLLRLREASVACAKASATEHEARPAGKNIKELVYFDNTRLNRWISASACSGD